MKQIIRCNRGENFVAFILVTNFGFGCVVFSDISLIEQRLFHYCTYL